MTTDTSGPAFPPTYGLSGEIGQGMSLRDWFAGQALASLGDVCPNLPGDPAPVYTWPSPEELAARRAKWAYLQADAFLTVRKGDPT